MTSNSQKNRPISDALREAKDACDLRAVMEQRGYEFSAQGYTSIRDERTPSVKVGGREPSRWKDFGSGEGGDLLDLLEAEGLDWNSAIEEAERLLGLSSTTPGAASVKSHTAKDAEDAVDYRSALRKAHDVLVNGGSKEAYEARAYLKHRGLDLENGALDVLTAAGVGVIDSTIDLPDNLNPRTYRGRITFPYVTNRRVPFFNARAAADVEPTEKFRKPAGASQGLAFLRHAVPSDARYVILVEAELDALSVQYAVGPDTPVLAAGGGGVKVEHLDGILEQLDYIFTLYDADESGQKFRSAAERAFSDANARVRHLSLPDGVKDANEALTTHGPQELRSSIRAQMDAERGVSDTHYIATTFLEELAVLHDRPHVNFPTGLAPVDRLLGGGYSEGLHVLGGITGGGKTSFALRLALNNALEGRPVLYATYEQSKRELWSRLAAAVTRIPYATMKSGTYEDRDGQYRTVDVLTKHEKFEELQAVAQNLVVVEAGDALSRSDGVATIDDLHASASFIKEQSGVAPLVVIDYLQRVPAPALNGREVRERVAHVAGLLQVGLARDLGATVLALSSLSRDGYKVENGQASPEALLKALKESGEVEYTAYTVAVLSGFQEGAEPPGMVPMKGVDTWKPKTFRLVKNREGETGDQLLRYHPRGEEWTAADEREGQR